MNEIKEINIKNCIYYYFDDLVNVNNLRLKNIIIDEKFINDSVICHIRYQIKYSINQLSI